MLLSNLENKDNTLFVFETTGSHETKLMTEGISDTIDAKIS